MNMPFNFPQQGVLTILAWLAIAGVLSIIGGVIYGVFKMVQYGFGG